MSRRGARTAGLVAVLVGLLVFAPFAWRELVFDPKAFLKLLGEQTQARVSGGDTLPTWSDLGRTYHRGEGPCLRYVDPPKNAAETATLRRKADEVVAALDHGEVLARLPQYFMLVASWSEADEAKRHGPTTDDEMLAFVSRIHQPQGAQKWVMAFAGKRIVTELRAREATHTRQREEMNRHVRNGVPRDAAGLLYNVWRAHRDMFVPPAFSYVIAAREARLAPRVREAQEHANHPPAPQAPPRELE